MLLVISYIMYFFYILKTSDEETQKQAASNEGINDHALSTASLCRELLLLVLSGIFIFLGAKFTIESLIEISDLLNIGKEVIAVSAVAIGTSLPELIVTINAAIKGKAEIAIGNVVGSNIFNTFVVIGIPGLFTPLPVPKAVIAQGIPTLVSTSLLMFFIAQDNKVTIWEGWLFVFFYVWFIGTLFNLI